MDKYAEDPTRYKDACEVANMMFIPNTINDAVLDKAGDFLAEKFMHKG